MKKISIEFIIGIFLGAAGFILAGIAYPSLPETITLGFGPGARTGPKGLIFILPALILFIPGLMHLGNRINPGRISNRSPKVRMMLSIALSIVIFAIECLVVFLPR